MPVDNDQETLHKCRLLSVLDKQEDFESTISKCYTQTWRTDKQHNWNISLC